MQHFTSATKYGFRIRTKNGAIVDKLLICGKDADEAERKLRQIYLGCEILERRRLDGMAQRNSPVSYEEVVDLISCPAGAGAAE